MNIKEELVEKTHQMADGVKFAVSKLKQPDEVTAWQGPDLSAVPRPDSQKIAELDRELEPPVPPKTPQMIQLDPVTMLNIELIATKKRLADSNEKLAVLALQEARKVKKELEKEEAELMVRVCQQVGAMSGNIRLIDRGQGLCQIE